MARAALVAERMNHHPDWSNVWNTVIVDLVTHSAGGITEHDAELARAFDALAVVAHGRPRPPAGSVLAGRGCAGGAAATAGRSSAADAPAGDDVVGLLVCPDVTRGRGRARACCRACGRSRRARRATTTSTSTPSRRPGVWASNVQGYCDEEVAEHAIALAVDLLRGTTLLDRDVRADGGWDLDAAPPRRIGRLDAGHRRLRPHRALRRTTRAWAWACAWRRTTRWCPRRPSSSRASARGRSCTTCCVGRRRDPARAAQRDRRATCSTPTRSPPCSPARTWSTARAPALVDHDALGEALRAGRLAGARSTCCRSSRATGDEPELRLAEHDHHPHAAWYSPDSAGEPYRRAAADLGAALSGGEPVYALARPAGR